MKLPELLTTYGTEDECVLIAVRLLSSSSLFPHRAAGFMVRDRGKHRYQVWIMYLGTNSQEWAVMNNTSRTFGLFQVAVDDYLNRV